VKLEVAEFVGKPLKPTPCRIIVHLHPDAQLVGGSEVYGRNSTVITDVVAKDVQ
jgi:hypothetical protein